MNAAWRLLRLVVIISAACSTLLFAPLRTCAGGNEFYLAFPDSPPGASLRLEIVSGATASGVVSIAGIDFSQPFVVPAGGQSTPTGYRQAATARRRGWCW